MDKDIYDYLKEYGLDNKEIDYIENKNGNIYYINLGYAIKIIDFLESKGCSKEYIIKLLVNNPYMITEVEARLTALDEIYLNRLFFNKEELKYLLLNNYNTYTISPIELNKIIDYLLENKYSIEMVKRVILSNPSIIEMKLDNFKKVLKLDK